MMMYGITSHKIGSHARDKRGGVPRRAQRRAEARRLGSKRGGRHPRAPLPSAVPAAAARFLHCSMFGARCSMSDRLRCAVAASRSIVCCWRLSSRSNGCGPRQSCRLAVRGAAPRPSMRVPGASPDTAPASVAAARARAPATRRPLRQPRPRFRSQRRRPRAEGARTLARTRLRPSDSAAQAPRHSAPRRDQAQRGQTGGVEKVSNIRTFDVLGVGERPAARSFAQRWCSGRARCAGRRGARGAAGGRPEGGRRTRRVRLVRGEGRNVSS